ncbi:hypothetical protein SLE2022_002380 [Rubroshorea leprosula]
MSSQMVPPVDIFDFVVNKGNGVKGLADSGIQSLPDHYILPPEERLDPTKIVTEDSIPIIDVSDWNDPKVTESICEAACTWGFFQIVNHGLTLEDLDKIKDAGHRFFGLPNQERAKYWKGKSPANTVSLFTSFSPHAEAVLEWKDFLSFRYVSGDPEASALWPPVCKFQVLEYMEKAKIVIKRLLEALLKGLNVKEIDQAREYVLMGSPIINFNYYPCCPSPELAAGVGPHSDISTITVLLQDDNGGLYVRATEGDCWIHVPPVNGALVVNVGDILQILSNDRYKSIEHRAVANGNKNRISVPIFVNPAPDAIIGPLPEVLEDGEKPIYREIVFSDYFKYFFSKGHEGKKTMDFARI